MIDDSVYPAAKSGASSSRKRRSRLSAKKRRSIFQRDNYTCTYCGKTLVQIPDDCKEIGRSGFGTKWSIVFANPSMEIPVEHLPVVDHVVPVSKGGSNHIDNLVTSCWRCNSKKRDKTVEEFLEISGGAA